MSEKIKLIAMSLLLFCSVFIYAEEKSEIETADEVLVTASKKGKKYSGCSCVSCYYR